MRWKINKSLKLGDERARIAFAWVPVQGDDGYIYWFEDVVFHERVVESSPAETYEAYGVYHKWEVDRVEGMDGNPGGLR